MMTFIVADRTVQSKGTFKGCYIYSFKKDGSRYKTATWHEAYGSKNADTSSSKKAQGKVLIGGLGLGMVLKCLLDKNDVTKVVVVEQSPDVIKLVASSYTNDPRVEIVNESIFEYKHNEHFDCAWFDIWDDISGEEYPEMKRLHRRFGRYVGWSDSWCRNQSRRMYYGS